jgi:predicted small metal-binding protein
MPRKYIDCREFPSDKNCTLAISGTEDEVLDLAVLHAVNAHGHKETQELREQLRTMLKDEAKRATA